MVHFGSIKVEWKIVQTSRPGPGPVAEIVSRQHENLDGSG
jgi:HD-GYP domain-containing protein (c-di-GMP phosphodiesterase class II)